MEPLTIRSSRHADVPAITAIYAHFVDTGTASFETEPPDETEMRRRREALLHGNFPFVVATLGERVCGYAYAGPYRTRAAYRYSVESSVYVERSTQRRGVGRALLHALIRDSTNLGFRQMVAIIGDSAHAASIRLHRTAGFKMVGTLRNVGFKHGRWLDSVLMQRALGDGANTPPPCQRFRGLSVYRGDSQSHLNTLKKIR